MSPRKKEQNELLRETRKLQILEATLTVYVKLGYNGTDMDFVAAEAGLAKGLIYYYYKTKQELFRAMFQWALHKTAEISEKFFTKHENKSPIKRLVHYILDFFTFSDQDPRIIQFAMRLPFDAAAVFGKDRWKDGVQKSIQHQKSIAMIIQKGVDSGEIPPVQPTHAANCFWAVFVANLFNFTRMIEASYVSGAKGTFENNVVIEDRTTPEDKASLEGNTASADKTKLEEKLNIIRDISKFCFQGLGLTYDSWGDYMEKIIYGRGVKNEGF